MFLKKARWGIVIKYMAHHSPSTILSSPPLHHIHELCVLNRVKPKLFKLFLQHCDPNLIHTLSEICYNIIYNNSFPLPKSKSYKFKKLKQQRKIIRELAKRKKSIKRKRKLFVQKGYGFLSIVLPLLIPLLSTLLSTKKRGGRRSGA